MTAPFHSGAIPRACGFAAGWAVFTAALLVATRPMGIGPGFSRPLPYAAAAILLCVSGHLIRRWLGEAGPIPVDATGGALRKAGREWLAGLRLFFKGPAAFNNFVFLSIAYFLGIGLTSMFIRKAGHAKSGVEGSEPSHWRDLDLGKQDADAYYRPY
ncbi:MAG: hypothetical protein JWP91_3780 [Fibrobacteres bacterium]|nr:hypothetical protein [Fibrobacterota bacterium]